MTILHDLTKLANQLDNLGSYKAANKIDSIIRYAQLNQNKQQSDKPFPNPFWDAVKRYTKHNKEMAEEIRKEYLKNKDEIET